MINFKIGRTVLRCRLGISILSLLLGLVCWAIGGEPQPAQLIRFFPTEAEMDDGKFFITNPENFAIHDDRLYLLDAGERQVLVFDLEGQYLESFAKGRGKSGQFQNPRAISAAGNTVIVQDGDSRFLIFDLAGAYQGAFETGDPVLAFVCSGDKVLAMAENARSKKYFALYDLTGHTLKVMRDQFEPGLDEGRLDRLVTLKREGGRIYAVQRFGTEYRIFTSRGQSVMAGRVWRSADQPRALARYRTTFTTFDYFADKFVAAPMAIGDPEFEIFDETGNVVKTVKLAGLLKSSAPGDIVKILDMDMVASPQGDQWLFLLLGRPRLTLIKLELDPSFWP